MELIKISENGGINAVSARELYLFLGYEESQFSRWAKEKIIDNWAALEHVDYERIDIVVDMPNNAQRRIADYSVTISFAKKLSMLAQTLKGEQIREYFIECEKKLLQPRELSRKELALMIVEAETAKELAEAKVKELAPKAEICDKISTSDELLTLNDAAKVLNIGRNTLMRKLREYKILMKNNTPYQHLIDEKLFEVKLKPFKIGDTESLYPQTMVTGKGMVWLTNHKYQLI